MGFNAYFPKPATSSLLYDALTLVCDDGSAFAQAKPLITRHSDLHPLVSHALDKCLLTGESLPLQKDGNVILNADIALGDRLNMFYQ